MNLTESQRLEAIAICDQITALCKKQEENLRGLLSALEDFERAGQERFAATQRRAR